MKPIIRLKRPETHQLTKKPYDYTCFTELAQIILNGTLLVTNTSTYRIREIEFYYCGENHQDTYTHCSEEQAMNCVFYFHKYKTGTYKSGTYKCLDITLSSSPAVYFGVLIRSIQDTVTGQFTEGPCRSVNKILEHYGVSTVADYVRDRKLPLEVYDTQNGFHLVHPVTLSQETIHTGPRIGLSDKYPEFKDRPYRYATCIEKISKKRASFS
jgi:hypothetical protein